MILAPMRGYVRIVMVALCAGLALAIIAGIVFGTITDAAVKRNLGDIEALKLRLGPNGWTCYDARNAWQEFGRKNPDVKLPGIQCPRSQY